MSGSDDSSLGYLLYRVARLLRRKVSAALSPLDLSLSEFLCMRALSINPGMCNAELSRQTNVTPQAMNAVLRRLQDAGLVARPASVVSGRALPAVLTTAGRALGKRAEAAVRAADAPCIARLTASEQREFRRILCALGQQ